MLRLKIRQRTLDPAEATLVFLVNDETDESFDLGRSGALLGLDLRMREGEIPTAAIRFRPDRVDVDAETLTLLQAHIDQRKSVRNA